MLLICSLLPLREAKGLGAHSSSIETAAGLFVRQKLEGFTLQSKVSKKGKKKM